MKRVYTLLLTLMFSFALIQLAFADVAGMGYLVAATILLPVLAIAIIVVSLVLISKAAAKKRAEKDNEK